MGILIHNTPSFYSLAGNDNAYVFRSTNFTPTQRFKVSVVPVDFPISPEIAVVRVSPRQGIDVNGVVTTDRAYYDPSRILQSLIGTDIAIPSVNHVGVFACPNTHTEYSLIVQEEDVVNGAYVGGASFTVSERSVWNGIRNEIDWLDFDYTDYDMTTPCVRQEIPIGRTINQIRGHGSIGIFALPIFRQYDKAVLCQKLRIEWR